MKSLTSFLAGFLLITSLFLLSIESAEAIQASQSTTAPCSPNIIIQAAKTTEASGGRVTESSVRTFASGIQPCVIVQPSLKLNALESAQRQLLIAQNPTRLSTQPMLLSPRLGDTNVSLWFSIRNETAFEAHGIRVEFAPQDGQHFKNNQVQTYMLPEMPDALIHRKNFSLAGNGSALLLAAPPEVLEFVLAQIPKGWCLYDVGSRAQDVDSDGYLEAQEQHLKTRDPGGTLELENSSTQSTPIAFTVQYIDIFDVSREFPVVGFLRTAAIGSAYVFYPSRKTIGRLQCLFF
jgi:hypothetical protein